MAEARKIASILAADVVDFSRMASTDDYGAKCWAKSTDPSLSLATTPYLIL